MNRLKTAALTLATALVVAALQQPGPAPALSAAPADPRPRAALAAGASLDVSPTNFVGGQGLVWRGNIGAPGRRKVRLQFNINRPGDPWMTVEGFSRTTDAKGNFRFTYQAPGMFGISYRLAAGRLVTPGYLFDAKSQDVTLGLTSGDRGYYGLTDPDQPFDFAVDTTPTLPRRQDSVNLPVFVGRQITLQRRQADFGWKSVARTTADADGMGYFRGLTEPQGVAVYRVRQEDWTKNGSAVGWFPSFPYYVYVGTKAPQRPTGQPGGSRGGEGSGRASDFAAKQFGWGSILYDYGWEQGESLNSKPDRGTQTKGVWEDLAQGSGRSTKHNGGLAVVSGRTNSEGPGDFGTTYVTMRNSAQKYGRWELRLRSKVLERGQGEYRMMALLVPAQEKDYGCGEHNIVIAEVASNGTTLSYGANAGRTQWRASRKIGLLDDDAPAFGVEVAKNHLTWFMNGKVTGVVRSRTAASGIPMTLRIALFGQGDTEMNHTSLFSDWQRSYSLASGKQVTRGPALKRTTQPSAC